MMTTQDTSLVGRDSRTVHDPFLNKDVEVSDRLTDRLRGRYARGPTMANGEPEFGWDEFPASPIQLEAARAIEKLQSAILTAEAQRDGAWEAAAKIAKAELDAHEASWKLLRRDGAPEEQLDRSAARVRTASNIYEAIVAAAIRSAGAVGSGERSDQK